MGKLMGLFLCKMSSFVCIFIYSISSYSPYPFLSVVDAWSIPMIPLHLYDLFIYTLRRSKISVFSATVSAS